MEIALEKLSFDLDFHPSSSLVATGLIHGIFFYMKSHLVFLNLSFEASTPDIGEAIGLGADVDYLYGIGMQRIHDYEKAQYWTAEIWKSGRVDADVESEDIENDANENRKWKPTSFC